MTSPCAETAQRRAACALRFEHELDLALCADIERLADALPHLPPGDTLRRLSDRLMEASRRWAGREWNELLASDAALGARIADSLHAEDLNDMLWACWRQSPRAAAGQLSYMLRVMFDGRRRAIALEEALLGCARCQSSTID